MSKPWKLPTSLKVASTSIGRGPGTENKDEYPKSKTEATQQNDQPLVVLSYKPWRIAWRLFFPFTLFLPILYMIAFYWAPAKSGVLPAIFQVVAYVFLALSMNAILDMLLTKAVRVYRERVVKEYRFLGSVAIPLECASIKLTSDSWMPSIRVVDKRVSPFLLWPKHMIIFDCNLSDSHTLAVFKKDLEKAGILFSDKNSIESFGRRQF